MDTAAVEVLINKLENAAFHHGTEYRVHGSDNYSAEWREARTKLDSAIEAIQQNAYAEGRKDEREEWEERILPLLRELHESEYLSEQQCAALLGADLIAWRFAEDGGTTR